MVCSYLATKLESVLSHGYRRLPDRELRLQLLVFNCCLLISISIALALGLLFSIFQQYSLLLNSVLPFLGVCGIVHLFKRQRYFLLARILFLVLNLASVGFGIYLYGKESHLSLYCIDLALLAFLLFRPREWPWSTIFAGSAFLLFTLIEFDGLGLEHKMLQKDLSPYASILLVTGAFTGAVAPSLLLFWQTNAGFRRALRRHRVRARDEKFAAIGRLAAGAAHEINNPLAIVQLTLENLEGSCEGLKDKAVQYRIRKGYDAIHRIHQILQKLLASSIAPIGKAESFLVQDVAQVIGQRCSRFLRMNDISLSIRSDLPDGYRVFCHRQSVIDVVDSLINNALEAMAGQGKPRIVLTLKCENLNFLVQVEDTGPGVTEEHLRSIFTPFYTTKDVGSGLGLSLYSARCIAQQFGGDLTCEQGPGGRFYLSLPIHRDQPVRQA